MTDTEKGFPFSYLSIFPFFPEHKDYGFNGRKISIELFSDGKCFSLPARRGKSFSFHQGFPPLCFHSMKKDFICVRRNNDKADFDFSSNSAISL